MFPTQGDSRFVPAGGATGPRSVVSVEEYIVRAYYKMAEWN